MATAQHGQIIAQAQDANKNGYTILKVWGTYEQMGEARGRLMANHIAETVRALKNVDPVLYNEYRRQIANTTWDVAGLSAEITGMERGVNAVVEPDMRIDRDDIKLLSTFGDWIDSPPLACRSSSAWGTALPSGTNVKTLSTRRLDYQKIDLFPFEHHMIVIYDPDPQDNAINNHTRWINFTWPGVVTSGTAVLENGTMVALHTILENTWDDPGTGTPLMTRMVAARYAALMDGLPDNPDEHFQTVFQQLSQYKFWTASFINYYMPEGNGGVISIFRESTEYRVHNPWDNFIITANSKRMIGFYPGDDCYIPFTNCDESMSFKAFYRSNGMPIKTLENHWNYSIDNALHNEIINHVFHQISIEVRNDADITLWFQGRTLDAANPATPKLEMEWHELYE